MILCKKDYVEYIKSDKKALGITKKTSRYSLVYEQKSTLNQKGDNLCQKKLTQLMIMRNC